MIGITLFALSVCAGYRPFHPDRPSVTRDFRILRFVSDASLAVVNPADLL